MQLGILLRKFVCELRRRHAIGRRTIADHLAFGGDTRVAHFQRLRALIATAADRSRTRMRASKCADRTRDLRSRLSVATRRRRLQFIVERVLQLSELDAILRPFRSGDARLYGCEIQFENARVLQLPFLRHAEESLRLEIVSKRG